MRIKDRFSMALRNLTRRKSRTILTVLSVVIGATSIILMLAFAEGINRQSREMIDSFGGLSTINVVRGNGEKVTKIEKSEIEKLARIEGVKTVVPSKSVYAQILDKNDDKISIDGQIQVIPDDVFNKLDQTMFEWGSSLKSSDKNQIILGPSVRAARMEQVDTLGYSMEPIEGFDYMNADFTLRLGYMGEEDDGVNFGDEDEESKKQDYVNIDLKVKGALNTKSFLTGFSSYTNETFFKQLLKEDQKLEFPQIGMGYDRNGQPIPLKNIDEVEYTDLSVVVDDPENIGQVEDRIRELGYQTYSNVQSAEEIKKSTTTITLILGAIGSVAFVVSAIGIINTMLMSIYERQKEIGVMKVIGASINDIRSLFLIESGFIGFFGGLVGLILSLLVGYILNTLLGPAMMADPNQKVLVITFGLGFIGVAFSSMVGVLAGYIPARRATRLSAIDALRSN